MLTRRDLSQSVPAGMSRLIREHNTVQTLEMVIGHAIQEGADGRMNVQRRCVTVVKFTKFNAVKRGCHISMFGGLDSVR